MRYTPLQSLLHFALSWISLSFPIDYVYSNSRPPASQSRERRVCSKKRLTGENNKRPSRSLKPLLVFPLSSSSSTAVCKGDRLVSSLTLAFHRSTTWRIARADRAKRIAGIEATNIGNLTRWTDAWLRLTEKTPISSTRRRRQNQFLQRAPHCTRAYFGCSHNSRLSTSSPTDVVNTTTLSDCSSKISLCCRTWPS